MSSTNSYLWGFERWIPGKALLYWTGIIMPLYGGGRHPTRTLGAPLEEVFRSKAVPRWRDKYCIIAGGWYLDTLRVLLRDGLGAQN